MEISAAFILMHVSSVVYGSNTRNTMFQHTVVLPELESCVDDSTILTKHESSSFGCGRLCSGQESCRRYMYDVKYSRCSLFKYGSNCITHEDVEDKACYRLMTLCDDNNCSRCALGYYGDQCQHLIRDCHDGFNKSVLTEKGSMVSFTQPRENGPTVETRCDIGGKAKTLILNRNYKCQELNFNKTFDEYSKGFGNPMTNYFFGLQNIHDITQNPGVNYILEVFFEFQDTSHWISYRIFNIADVSDNYRLSIGSFHHFKGQTSGDAWAKDPYSTSGSTFSTYDRDFTNHSCPERFGGGWWYLDDPVCGLANIIGKRSGEVPLHWLNLTDFATVWLRLKPS